MTFNRFIRTIKKDFEEVLNKKIPSKEVNSILNSRLDTVKGQDFYKILVLVSSNFDQDCERAFQEIIQTKKKEYLKKKSSKVAKNKKSNRYQDFINQFIVLQSDIADEAYIENTRFTKVLNLQNNGFYAYEVYTIAISQGISAKRAFEQLYKE